MFYTGKVSYTCRLFSVLPESLWASTCTLQVCPYLLKIRNLQVCPYLLNNRNPFWISSFSVENWDVGFLLVNSVINYCQKALWVQTWSFSSHEVWFFLLSLQNIIKKIIANIVLSKLKRSNRIKAFYIYLIYS